MTITKPDWAQARRMVKVLTGKLNPVICLQTFDDTSTDKSLGAHMHGRLCDRATQEWLVPRIKRGAGVYWTVNKTDGTGRRAENIVEARCCFIDLDGAPLPDKFAIDPTLIVETSPGRFHVYWRLECGVDLARWRKTQARLAACYGGDAHVHDLPRVLRLAGFDHQKAEPFRVQVVRWPAIWDDRQFTLDELNAAHPVEFQAPAPTLERAAPKDLKLDTPSNIARGVDYLHLADRDVPQGERNNTAYKHACKLRDLGLSPDVSRDLLERWNAKLADPLPQQEIGYVIGNAGRYRQNAPGAETTEAEFDFEGEDDADEQEIEQRNVIPAVRLEHVTHDNINQVFKAVNLGGRLRILFWGKSPLDPRARVPQFMTVQDFKAALVNKTYRKIIIVENEHGEKEEQAIAARLADDWLKSKSRRTYDGLVIEREQSSDCPESINLWRGYGVEPQAGDWSLMRKHIRDVIANGKPERDKYIIQWLAWALQNPEKPAEVALVLKSAAHGTGKGLLLRTMRKLFGVHGLQISKAGLLTGRFNSHLAMCCFLFVDEMTIGDNKETATLNSTLTEDVLAIEPKGVDVFQMPNHVKVACASNQDHVVHVGDTDRRFAIFEVSGQRAQDHKYFAAITAQLEAGGYGAMLADLLAIDLEEFHPRQLPNDQDANAEKVRSAPSEIEWLAGYLDSAALDCQAPFRGGASVLAGDFFDRARRTVRGLASWSDNRFAEFLKDWGCMRRRSNGTRWEFPPLLEMRAAFRKRYPWWREFEQADAWHDSSGGQEEDMPESDAPGLAGEQEQAATKPDFEGDDTSQVAACDDHDIPEFLRRT